MNKDTKDNLLSYLSKNPELVYQESIVKKTKAIEEPDDINEIREIVGLRPKGYTAFIKKMQKYTHPINLSYKPKSELVMKLAGINKLIEGFRFNSIDEDVEVWMKNWYKDQLTLLEDFRVSLTNAKENATDQAPVNIERLQKAHKWLRNKVWIDTSEQVFISIFTEQPIGKVHWKGSLSDCCRVYYFLANGDVETEKAFKSGLKDVKPKEINDRFSFDGGKEVESGDKPVRNKSTTRTSNFKALEKHCK